MIVDYKRKGVPRKKALAVRDDGTLGDLQMAGYIVLCEHAGLRVTRALFWSIEKAEPAVVIGPKGARTTPEDYSGERGAFLAALRDTAASIRAGGFSEARPWSGRCPDCRWRPACRAHYSTEGL